MKYLIYIVIALVLIGAAGLALNARAATLPTMDEIRACLGSTAPECQWCDLNGNGVINNFDILKRRGMMVTPTPKAVSSSPRSSTSSAFSPYQMCQKGLFAQSICSQVTPWTTYQSLVH